MMSWIWRQGLDIAVNVSLKQQMATSSAEHDDDEIDDKSIVCQYCDQSFSEFKDLMAHKKIKHVERVSLRWNFMDGSCFHGEQKCWFRHEGCQNKQEQK